jgi:transcriptional regulator GlxA family with amidase domain
VSRSVRPRHLGRPTTTATRCSAEELLESTDLPIEQIASRVGYRSAAVLREQFTLRRGVAPRDYRRTFSRN